MLSLEYSLFSMRIVLDSGWNAIQYNISRSVPFQKLIILYDLEDSLENITLMTLQYAFEM